MNLHEIGLRYRTDKGSYHGYLDYYDTILTNLRHDPIRFLEIGISTGSSLKMWEDYFTKAEIFGADIRSEEERIREFGNLNIFFDETRTKTFVVNQEITEDLFKLPENLDVIIDDGGHTMFQQQNTLKTIFKNLKPGGIYILEDLHTSTPEFWDSCDYGRTNTNNTIKLLTDLSNKTLSDDREYYLNDVEFNELLREIESIEIKTIKPGSITSLIRKK